MAKSKSNIWLLPLFAVALFISSPAAFAGTYWVSPNGTATWANAQSASPLSGTASCSLATANSNASAGDLIYLRAGTYSTSIAPTNSGSYGNVITFRAYSGETAVIQDVTAVKLRDNDYIKVDGIDGLDAGRGGYNIIMIENGSSYNEICNGHFRRTGEPWTKGYSLMSLRYSGGDGQYCVHNWIHNNEMHDSGSLEWVGSECNDEGRLITIGSSFGVDYGSGYNTFEENHMYRGGHHVLEIETSYNVIRNNTIHNECFMGNFNDMPNKRYSDCASALHAGCEACGAGDPKYEKYGGRCVMFSNTSGGYCLFEGNRVGFAGRPPDDAGGNNIVTRMPNVIIRYNYSFGASQDGIYLRDSVDNNAIYNNTVYYNGRLENGLPFGSARFAGISIASSGVLGNQVINNIVYNNGDDWFGGYAHRWLDTTLRGNFCTTNETDFCDDYGDPKFANTALSWWNNPAYTATRPDLSLQSGSPCIDAGSYLTQANGSGSNSATLIVDNAIFFQDGTWGSSLSSVNADYIAIGTVSNSARIISINYSTNTIYLASAMTWSDNAPVWVYADSDGTRVLYGSAPDVGAYESPYGSSPPPPPPPPGEDGYPPAEPQNLTVLNP